MNPCDITAKYSPKYCLWASGHVDELLPRNRHKISQGWKRAAILEEQADEDVHFEGQHLWELSEPKPMCCKQKHVIPAMEFIHYVLPLHSVPPITWTLLRTFLCCEHIWLENLLLSGESPYQVVQTLSGVHVWNGYHLLNCSEHPRMEAISVCLLVCVSWWSPVPAHQYHVLFPMSSAAQHSSQSPVSLTSDASSPRPYVSPRNGTPQNNQKALGGGMHPGNIASTQTRVSAAT